MGCAERHKHNAGERDSPLQFSAARQWLAGYLLLCLGLDLVSWQLIAGVEQPKVEPAWAARLIDRHLVARCPLPVTYNQVSQA